MGGTKMYYDNCILFFNYNRDKAHMGYYDNFNFCLKYFIFFQKLDSKNNTNLLTLKIQYMAKVCGHHSKFLSSGVSCGRYCYC